MPTATRRIAWTILVFLTLLAAWELFARRFSSTTRTLAQYGRVFVDNTRNEDLNGCFERLPAPAAPRVLILGSSQIATVKNGKLEESLPFTLQHQLESTVGPVETLDFSAGGQQVAESLIILLGALDRVRPQVVVLGLGLFSTQGANVRPSVIRAFDRNQLTQSLTNCAPADAAPRTLDVLTDSLRSAPPPGVGKTIQERIDQRISEFLTQHFAAYRHRKSMFNELIDSPVRKDLVAFVNRNILGTKVARTMGTAATYDPSLLAVEIMACHCRRAGVPFVAVLMPYDASITPVPYRPDSQERLVKDISVTAARAGFTLVDFSRLLDHPHFGTYVDGSPDGLHYRASGHALLAGQLAKALENNPALRRSP